jgi:hypothetical protein
LRGKDAGHAIHDDATGNHSADKFSLAAATYRLDAAPAAPAAAGGGGLVVDFDLRWWITTDLE